MSSISNMTSVEAMDVETFATLSRMFQKARNAGITALKYRKAVLQAIEDMCIDTDKRISGLHGEITLEEAIETYLNNGNINLKVILKNLKEWYGVEL